VCSSVIVRLTVYTVICSNARQSSNQISECAYRVCDFSVAIFFVRVRVRARVSSASGASKTNIGLRSEAHDYWIIRGFFFVLFVALQRKVSTTEMSSRERRVYFAWAMRVKRLAAFRGEREETRRRIVCKNLVKSLTKRQSD